MIFILEIRSMKSGLLTLLLQCALYTPLIRKKMNDIDIYR